MRCILDTHAFLWFMNGDSRLSDNPRELILDAGNERFLSVASLWEMAIKESLGRLELPLSFAGTGGTAGSGDRNGIASDPPNTHR